MINYLEETIMKCPIRPRAPYLLPIFIAYYLLPFLIRDTGSGMAILLVIIPIVCAISSFIHGTKSGFDVVFALLAGVLFIPSIFIYYNSSAWVYTIIYGVISLIGNFIGSKISKY